MNAKTVISNYVKSEYSESVVIYLNLLSSLFDRITAYNFCADEILIVVGFDRFSNGYEFIVENRKGTGLLDIKNILGFDSLQMLTFAEQPAETDLNEILLNIHMLKKIYKFLSVTRKMKFKDAEETFKKQTLKKYLQKLKAPAESPKLDFTEA